MMQIIVTNWIGHTKAEGAQHSAVVDTALIEGEQSTGIKLTLTQVSRYKRMELFLSEQDLNNLIIELQLLKKKIERQ